MSDDFDRPLHVLSGYRTATLPDPDANKVLGIEYLPTPEDVDTEEREWLFVCMTPEFARELGEALLRLAEAPHIPEPPSGRRM